MGRGVHLLLNYSLQNLFVKSCYIRTVTLKIKISVFQGYLGFVRHFRSAITYSTIARRIQGAAEPYLRTNGHSDDPSACSRVNKSLWPCSTRTTHARKCPQLITFWFQNIIHSFEASDQSGEDLLGTINELMLFQHLSTVNGEDWWLFNSERKLPRKRSYSQKKWRTPWIIQLPRLRCWQ